MSWPYPQYEPQIVYLTSTNSWLCRVRRISNSPADSTFKSLEGPKPPIHTTPNEALEAARIRIADLESTRNEVLASEALKRLTEDKPRLRPVMVPNPDKGPKLKMWEAQKDDGTWTEPQATPHAAVKLAMRKG